MPDIIDEPCSGDETEDETAAIAGTGAGIGGGARAPLPPFAAEEQRASFVVSLPLSEFPEIARLSPREASETVSHHLRIARAAIACSRISFATDEVRETMGRVAQEARVAQARQIAESEASTQQVRRAAQGVTEAVEVGLRDVRRAQEALIPVVRDAVVAASRIPGNEVSALGAAVSEVRSAAEGLQRTLANLSLTAASSSARGRLGEAAVETYFRERLLPGDEMESVAASAESCDLVVRRSKGRSGLIAIEVKSYTGTVPSAQYEKFLRDISRYPKDAVGIFVSLGQPIAHRPAFALEHDPEGRILLVAPNADLAVAWTSFRVACVLLEERNRSAEACASRAERDREYERFRGASDALVDSIRALLARAQAVARAAGSAEDSLRELRSQAESMYDGVIEAVQGAFAAAGLSAAPLPAPPDRAPRKRRKGPP